MPGNKLNLLLFDSCSSRHPCCSQTMLSSCQCKGVVSCRKHDTSLCTFARAYSDSSNAFHPWDTKVTCSILIITKVIQIPFHLQLPKLLIIFPNFTDTICYDDACQLKKFTQNLTRNQLTNTAKKMSQMVMVCDKFHFKNHKDMWCKRNCSPYTYASLQVRFPLIQYHDYFNLLYRHDCLTGTAKYTRLKSLLWPLCAV